ncbi:MAG: phage holin family protein [Patescibacteria group bacterium]|jgi:putative membrane protein
MLQLLLRFVLNALAVMATAYIVPGITVANFWVALIAAIVIGVVNALVRPILLILTLPINILTLGIFTLVINALMFWLAAYLVKGFDVASFGTAFLGALVFWVVSWFTNALLVEAKK